MKNFSVKVEGKEYWISRSVATACLTFKEVDNAVYALVSRRGKGAADNVDKLCFSCGYLEYDLTLKENMKKEMKEELGFIADENKFEFLAINDKPTENHQNVTVRFAYWADKDEDFDTSKAIGGEKDEVSEVKWFKVGILSNDKKMLYVNTYSIMEEDWAFDHDTLMIEYLSSKYNLAYNETEKKEK